MFSGEDRSSPDFGVKVCGKRKHDRGYLPQFNHRAPIQQPTIGAKSLRYTPGSFRVAPANKQGSFVKPPDILSQLLTPAGANQANDHRLSMQYRLVIKKLINA